MLADDPDTSTTGSPAGPAAATPADHAPGLPRAGDDPTTAIERLVDVHGAGLRALAFRFCGDRDRADDLVQEVYLQAFRGWSGFEGRSDPRTWLYTIAARACNRMRRRRSGEPSRIGSLDDLLPFGEARIATIPAAGDDVLTERVRNEARERLEDAIPELPDDFRLALVLKEIVGLPSAEVAAILGVEETTVRTRVHRARLRLRKAVDGALPRSATDAPPPAYPRQTCLDLLDAKQQALDRGVPFDRSLICDRCRSVFATLDLAQDVCRELAEGALPPELRERICSALRSPKPE